MRHCIHAQDHPWFRPEPQDTAYGYGIIVDRPIAYASKTCPESSQLRTCRVWLEQDIFTEEPQSRWFRRVDVDDIEKDDKNGADRLKAWDVAFRTGLEREPALLLPSWSTQSDPSQVLTHTHEHRSRSIFLPHHYLAFVQLECPELTENTSLFVEPDSLPLHSFRSATEMASRKIVTIGDLHGDAYNAVMTFYMAGIIDLQGHWAGGSHTIFVQTGDIVDRGDDTIVLFSYLEQLKQEAFTAGGEFIQLLGNHELMNMGGDLRFVTPQDILSFGSLEMRRQAFRASGFIGRHLFRLPLVHRVGNTVFAHGGISEKYANMGIHGVNQAKDAQIDAFVKEPEVIQQYVKWPMFADEGPAWYRGYAEQPEPQVCPQLRRVLRSLGAERMIVGHTVQLSGKVLVRCQGRFIVQDVGISRVYGGNIASVELQGDQVWVVYPQGKELIADGFQD